MAAVREAEIEQRAAELVGRQAQIDELERLATELSERVVVRERALRELRLELARVREESDAGLRALAALADDLEAVRRQARGQATRIRMRALREAAELSERISELSQRPSQVRDRMLESLREAIVRVGQEDEREPALEMPMSPNGSGHAEPAELFEGLIEVEIGPLADFSQLVGFEDAAGAIAATSEISVKRFARRRATLEMKLAEPVALLRELEGRAPFEFEVRDTRSDRVVLDVDEERREAA
ncbi:MAG TPA: hypothetical protein VHJ54_07270 [Solirubrobacterales bacterium]|nr:hypothetical protein [Solirubrobacterales bacterium]